MHVELKVVIGPKNGEGIGTRSVEDFLTSLAQNFNHKASRPLYQMYVIMHEHLLQDDAFRWRIYPWEEPNNPDANTCKLFRPHAVKRTVIIGPN